MAKGNSGLGSCVIVVGDPCSELVQTTVRLARDGEIEALPCDNVYSAVAGVAGATARRLLVVGQVQDLAQESGAFFRIAAAHATPCCCLLDKRRPAGRDDLLAALRAGVEVIGDVQDVGRVLREWLATAGPQSAPRVGLEASQARRRAQDAADATYEDLRATEAELRALLG